MGYTVSALVPNGQAKDQFLLTDDEADEADTLAWLTNPDALFDWLMELRKNKGGQVPPHNVFSGGEGTYVTLEDMKDFHSKLEDFARIDADSHGIDYEGVDQEYVRFHDVIVNALNEGKAVHVRYG